VASLLVKKERIKIKEKRQAYFRLGFFLKTIFNRRKFKFKCKFSLHELIKQFN